MVECRGQGSDSAPYLRKGDRPEFWGGSDDLFFCIGLRLLGVCVAARGNRLQDGASKSFHPPHALGLPKQGGPHGPRRPPPQ